MPVSEMSGRERMLAAINHQEVDRVPTDIWAVDEIWDMLRKHFGVQQGIAGLLKFDGMGHPVCPYIGPSLVASDHEQRDEWGVCRRKTAYDKGVYWDIVSHPLADASTIDDLEAYNWPKAEWYDYNVMRQQAQEFRKTKVTMFGYMAVFTYHTYLRGQENALMDPLVEPELTRHMLGKLSDFLLRQHRRALEAAEGLVDIVQVTDDLGSQKGPIMSLSSWREFYKPHFKSYCDLAHEFGCKVFHHDDGAMRDFIPDLIECGVDILNPVQWPCPGMQQEGLKRDFGDRLCFHGGIDNQRIMPFGTVEEVRAEVRHNIDALASDHTGYILAPCHALQANTPVENILAMYDEAHNYGKLR